MEARQYRGGSGAGSSVDARAQVGPVRTRVWIEEYRWLRSLLGSERNECPTFRFPDLISACVSHVLADPDGARRIFQYLRTQLVLRDDRTPRREQSMWPLQYEMLLALQLSPANLHPNPNFKLDQLTTACVALSRRGDESGESVFKHARMNVARRYTEGQDATPGRTDERGVSERPPLRASSKATTAA